MTDISVQTDLATPPPSR